MRDALKEIFMAGLRRADPTESVAKALDETERPDLILALGKAAIAMSRPALARFPGTTCLVVTNRENAADLTGARVMVGGHPVPDEGSLAAGEALLEAAKALGAGKRALVLVSGGGSALAVAPAAGISLCDKATTSRLLLAAGLDITAMNTVRQALSRLKGGGLARALAPATGEALVLSDVIGDDPATIASGPTVPSPGTRAEARMILTSAGLWDRLPASCRAVLSGPQAPPAPGLPWRLVESNRLSAEAMLAAAPGAILDPEPLVGDVAAAAARVARAATRPGTWLWGGETTVVLRGAGRGGRNQELALLVALALDGVDRPWAFLSGGTDGRDGPTDAAGAIVDGRTISRIEAADLDPQALLADNDSHTALAAAGDLLMTGGTGTNVADLQILRVG